MSVTCCVLQVAACASSRYELEVFSGEVVRVDSEALVQEQSLLLAAARTANPWRQQPLASVHQMVVCDPDGQARTFRFGTESADVPAQVHTSAAHPGALSCSPRQEYASALPCSVWRLGAQATCSHLLLGPTSFLCASCSSPSGD